MSRILLVDDDLTLLGLLRRYLERQGHEVVTCDSAERALAQFREAPEGFDLVVTDLTLTGMNGEGLIGEMRKLKPGIPALIASGYPHIPQLKRVRFLQKPFLPQMLAEAITKSLK